MADQDDLNPDLENDFYDEESIEVEAPRRAASAEFDVEGSVGSDAILREAMDPANQSLREALRLSYRVLQVVILVLIVVFIFSGFAKVDSQESGVMLRFGSIVGDEGNEALEPGLAFSVVPYPAGEFVIFQEKNRQVSTGRAFWPQYDGTFDAAVEAASMNDRLKPGPNRNGDGDGFLLTLGGEVGHLQMVAEYDVDDPVQFVKAVSNMRTSGDAASADNVMRALLMRAAVHTAASRKLEDLVEFDVDVEDTLRRNAQDEIDRLKIGVKLTSIETPIDPTPALSIRKTLRDLEEAKAQTGRILAQARQQVESALIVVAGANYQSLLSLIDEYELAVLEGDESRAELALVSINDALEDPSNAGETAGIIQRANAHSAYIQSTLGRRAQRFAGLLPAWRENRELLIARLWSESFARAVSARDTEVVYVPTDGDLVLNMEGNELVQKERREKRLEESESRDMSRLGDLRRERRASDVRVNGEKSRMLERSGRPGEI